MCKNTSFLKREVLENSEHFSPLVKTYIFLADKAFAPPPLTDMSAKNIWVCVHCTELIAADKVN